MAYINKWDEIFKNFSTYFPSTAAKTVDWWPSGRFEITAKLSDSSKVVYNDLNNTMRSIKQNDIPNEREWRSIFAGKLNDLMRINGMSVLELSDKTELSRQIISSYINARRTPHIHNLIKIANALGCSLADLTEFRDPD